MRAKSIYPAERLSTRKRPSRMKVQAPRWLKVAAVMATITGVGCWLAAGVMFFLAVGPPRNTTGLVVAGALFLAGFAVLVFFTLVNYEVRRHGQPPIPLEPERAAAVRRATVWVIASWLPIAAGLAWLVYAAVQWPRPRGPLIGAAGLMAAVGVSIVMTRPTLELLGPGRRTMGMSAAQFTAVGGVFTFLLAIMLLLSALSLR